MSEHHVSIEELKSKVRYVPKTGEFFWLTARCAKYVGAPAGWWANTGYRMLMIGEKKLLAHRVAWILMTGEWPKFNIDHADGDPSNNKWSNLRDATQSQNLCNKVVQSNCKSGVQGVVWRDCRKKWHAYANINGKFHHLGYYDTLDEATEARRVGALRLHGEFALVARSL